MPQIIPPGFSQVIVPFKHAASPREAIITWGQENTLSPPTSVSCDAVLTIIDDWWSSTIDNQVTIGPVVMRVGSDPGPGPVVEGTNSVAGGNASDQLPQNVAMLVRKRTAQGGRENRGRFYIPWGLQENSVGDTGVIDGAYVGTVQTQMDGFLADLAANSACGPMVILHSEVGTPTPVTTLVVDNLVATQRRRLGR